MSICLPAADARSATSAATVEAGPPFSETAARHALTDVLASEKFRKSQRMCRLLQFLVEQRFAGSYRETNEYAVGIEVFDRDPATYSTCADPIVRVQVGRLREKLKAYYAFAGSKAAVRFYIPVGSYMPEIHPMHPAPSLISRKYLLAIAPMGYSANDADCVEFARGLNDELAHRLFRAFGQTIVSHTADIHGAGVSHRLECGLRVHGEQTRLSARLIDSTSGCIAWAAQFDQNTAYTMALQEQMAIAICDELKQYFADG